MHPRVAAHAELAGADAEVTDQIPPGGLLAVAGNLDSKFALESDRLLIRLSHGVGQRYEGVATIRPHRVVAMLTPGEVQAARLRQDFPTLPTFAVGCPKLDRYHPPTRRRPGARPVVAVSWHWNSGKCPESRSAFIFYRKALRRLATSPAFELIGHGHPREWRIFRAFYENIGIEPVEHFSEVIERADVYCCDNSSTLFEFASLDRPVVVVNSPKYRRNVNHGMRFWEFADIGLQVDHGNDLEAVICDAIEDRPEVAERRREITRTVYGPCDGRAAERAADALREIEKEWT